MPFPKQTPPALRTPGEEYEEPEVDSAEGETPAPSGLDALGEEFGLDSTSTRQFARKLMKHFMGQCGGEANESDTESYPA